MNSNCVVLVMSQSYCTHSIVYNVQMYLHNHARDMPLYRRHLLWLVMLSLPHLRPLHRLEYLSPTYEHLLYICTHKIYMYMYVQVHIEHVHVHIHVHVHCVFIVHAFTAVFARTWWVIYYANEQIP